MGVTCTRSVRYLVQGDKGERGAVLRGPQDWESLEEGYAFESGGDGDTYLDCVVYSGYYYLCKKNHTKASDNWPGSASDINNGWWQLGDTVALVAATLLLAQYSLIKNLGVEALEMYDGAGDVVAYIKDGEISIRTGTFENVTVSGTLRGVTGTFRSLACYDNEDVTLSFSGTGLQLYGGDILHNGTYDGRMLRLLASSVWCRGSFGAAYRLTVVVSETTARYYADGVTVATYHYAALASSTYNGKTYYTVPCYLTDEGVAGMAVDTVVFRNTEGTYYYHLSLNYSQRVTVVNAANTYYTGEVYVAYAGGDMRIAGGMMAEFQNFHNFQYSQQSGNVPGCGVFAGGSGTSAWV